MIEATMVMPLTIIIVVMLIGLMVMFFNEFTDNIKGQKEVISDYSISKEIEIFRWANLNL